MKRIICILSLIIALYCVHSYGQWNNSEKADDTAYGVSWDGSKKAATQNALYDIISALGGGHDAITLDANAQNLLTLTDQALGIHTQVANRVYAGPITGADAVPTFRALVAGDIPTLNQNTTGTAAGLTAQYIDWNAVSGGASIANKPTLLALGELSTNAYQGDRGKIAYDHSQAAHAPAIDWTTDQGATNIHAGNYTDTNTTYTASGTLLNLTGTAFSVNEGTLTNGKYCTYVTGTGLVCNSDSGAMTYPGAGIAVSTGSAWGASITNNSANWNTAYGWGDHASAGYYNSLADLQGSVTNDFHNLGGTDANTTYVSSDFNHDDLTGFVANEHIDWTADQGATNIHSGNVPLAATASALASDPSDCTGGQFATGIAANGNLTCGTPSGGGDVTAASAFGTDNRVIRSDGTGKGVQVSVVAIDDDGNVTGVKSITTTKTSGVAGDMGLYEANSTDTDTGGFRGPASLTANTSYRGQLPNARATSDKMVLAWTNSGESGTGTPSDPYVQQQSFIDLDSYLALSSLGTNVQAALGNTLNGSGGLVTPDGTKTLTNTTYSTAGTGNDFTAPLNGVFDNSITDPADSDDLIYAKSMNAATITNIYCIAEGGGTITLTLQECDSAGANCGNIENAITCDSDGAEDDGTLTDGSFAANGWIKALFSAPSGTVNSLAWSVKGTQTW